MENQDISRRRFLGASALAAAGFALVRVPVFGAPAYIKNLGKPNSLFNGVQVGAITYSWRSLPVHCCGHSEILYRLQYQRD
jgi:hypothetical protein